MFGLYIVVLVTYNQLALAKLLLIHSVIQVIQPIIIIERKKNQIPSPMRFFITYRDLYTKNCCVCRKSIDLKDDGTDKTVCERMFWPKASHFVYGLSTITALCLNVIGPGDLFLTFRILFNILILM